MPASSCLTFSFFSYRSAMRAFVASSLFRRMAPDNSYTSDGKCTTVVKLHSAVDDELGDEQCLKIGYAIAAPSASALCKMPHVRDLRQGHTSSHIMSCSMTSPVSPAGLTGTHRLLLPHVHLYMAGPLVRELQLCTHVLTLQTCHAHLLLECLQLHTKQILIACWLHVMVCP